MSIETGPSGGGGVSAPTVSSPFVEGRSSHGIKGPSITIGSSRSSSEGFKSSPKPSKFFSETAPYHTSRPSSRDNTRVRGEFFTSMPTIWQRGPTEASKPTSRSSEHGKKPNSLFESTTPHVAKVPDAKDHKPKEAFRASQAQPSASLYERPKPITQPKNAHQTPGVGYSHKDSEKTHQPATAAGSVHHDYHPRSPSELSVPKTPDALSTPQIATIQPQKQHEVSDPKRQKSVQFRQRIHEMAKEPEMRVASSRVEENNHIKPREHTQQDIAVDAKPKIQPVKTTTVEQRLQTVRQELQHIATTKPENAKTQVVHRVANSPQTKEHSANVFAKPVVKEQPKPEVHVQPTPAKKEIGKIEPTVVTKTKTVTKQTEAMTQQRSSSVYDAPSSVGTVAKIVDAQPQTQETVTVKVTSTSVGYLERLRKAGVIEFFKKKVAQTSLPNSGVVIEKEEGESRKQEVQHDVPVNEKRAEILVENAQKVFADKHQKQQPVTGKDLVVEDDVLPPSGLAVEREQKDFSIPRTNEEISREKEIYSPFHAKKKIEDAITEFPGVKNDEPKHKQASKEEIENVVNAPVTIFEVQTRLAA